MMSILAEEGVSHLSFTTHSMGRQNHDALTYVRQFYLHTGIRPKIMMIGPHFAAEYFSDSAITDPIATYPCWSSKTQTFDDLIDLCEHEPEHPDYHLIVLTNCERGNSQWWTNLFRLQYDFPHVKFYLNGSNSFHLNFGGRFEASDVGFVDPGNRNNKIYLPAGNKMEIGNGTIYNLPLWSDWVELMGFTVMEILNDGDKRLRFNVRSALWASKHYADNFRFTKTDVVTMDATLLSEDEYVPRSSHAIIARRRRITTKMAEKILCDRCSIANSCRVYRSGYVCGLKESEMAKLSDSFQSRDAGKIIDGLAQVAKRAADRVETAMEIEEDTGVQNPAVTAQLKSLFTMGKDLAKLVDPELAGPGVKVQVNVGTGGNTQVVAQGNPKTMIASIFKVYEDAGFKREEVSMDMVKAALENMGRGKSPLQAIEAQRVTREAKEAEDLKNNIINGEPARVSVPALPYTSYPDLPIL